MVVSRPNISIITPSYNQARFLVQAIESVTNQNCASVEHIVVDGASRDDSVAILKEYSSKPGWQHLRWISEPDRGQSDALNKGIGMATGELIGWLNSDDRYRPGCFDAVFAAARRYPQDHVYYGDYTWIDSCGRYLQVRREIEFSRFVLGYHHVLYIPTTSTFFRRKIFEEGNWIDTRYDYAMDYEFFLRLSATGYCFRHIPELLADFRWHSQSKSSSATAKQLAEHDEIARRYSALLRNMPTGLPLTATRSSLRLLAAGRRYAEKLCRGYYFEQYHPAK
ncbi:MAG: glycosyltransferase [Acidobacteria bacterium]|nr:glycosyltransferase [Acidobacteriota bacterium]